MDTRKTLVAVTLTAVLGTAGIAVAASPAVQPAPVERATGYYRVGPSAVYQGDSGGIGVVDPLRVELPGGPAREGVVEATFTYTTRGPGPFTAEIGLEEVGGGDVISRPGGVDLAPAPDGATATVRVWVPELAGGSSYDVHVAVNSVFRARGTNAVRTRGLVLTADLG